MPQLYESQNDIYSLLPVKIYRHDLKGHFIYTPLHFHRSIELTVTLSGNMRFNSGSNDFDCSDSDWLLVNSCELHSCRYINLSDTLTGVSILFSLPFIEKWLGKDILFIHPDNSILASSIQNIASEIYQMSPEDNRYNFLLMSRIYELLALLSQYCVSPCHAHPVSCRHDTDTAVSLTDYIEKHYQENLTLAAAAAYFQYSPSYFSRNFKEILGVNFHSYLNFVRVSHAAEQLSSSPENLTTCAFRNGFPNIKSFINTFKRIYGCTPGAFVSSMEKISL